MARPIEATPDLYGEDARIFLKKMEEPPTEEQKKYAQEIKSIRRVHIWGDKLGDE